MTDLQDHASVTVGADLDCRRTPAQAATAMVAAIAVAFALILAAAGLARAQSTNAQLQAEIAARLPSSSPPMLTAANLRQTLLDMLASTNVSGTSCPATALSSFQPFANTSAGPTGTVLSIWDGTQCVPLAVLNQTAHTLTVSNLAAMAADSVKCNPTNSTGAAQDCNAIGLVGSQTITALASTNGTYAGSNTGAINWCPAWPGGCSNGTAGGTWTAQNLLVGTTVGDASKQESQLMSVVFVNTGFAFAWTASTSYASGNYATNGTNLYQEITASCTSAGSGGPTGTGSNIADNTCHWNYIAPSFVAGKQAGNFNTIGQTGGGKIWGLTSEAVTQSGWQGLFAAGAEIDAGNASSVTTTFGTAGASQIYNLYLGGINSQPITAALYISPQGSASPAPAQYGIILNGAGAFSSAVILNNSTGSTVGYADQGSHTSSSIADSSTSPIGINLTGSYSGAAINIAPSSGTNAINVASGKSICFNASSGCASWNSGDSAIQAPALAVIPGSGNANLYFTAGSQTWDLVVNSSTSAASLFDSTNSKTPFSIAANSANNTLQVTTTGISFVGGVSANGNAGVTCGPTTPSASFQVNNGIVIHC